MKKIIVATSFVTLSLINAESPKVPAQVQSISQVNPKLPADPTKKDITEIQKGTGAVAFVEPSYVPGGCGFRKALAGLVKVYEICFFGKGMKATEWSSAFDGPAGMKSFKLKLNFLRGVGGKAVSAAFSEGISKTPAAQKLEELERQKFLAWAAKLKIEKESVMELTFIDEVPLSVAFYEKPNSGTQAQTYVSKQVGLAKAMAAIWFGDKPLNKDLKADLLK
ncbi:MAG: chalcone isomerase family protein [Bdellovibrionota bacterium]